MVTCDWIFAICFLIMLGLLIVLPLIGGKLRSKEGSSDQIKFCVKKRNMFIRVSMIWYVIYYSVTLISLLATIIVIYLCTITETDELRIFLYSVISLFATIMNFVLNPREVASVYRKCFNKLDRAIAKKSNEDPELMKTVYECEDMVTNNLR